MISNLKISNIGPVCDIGIEFGQRFNLITGDNFIDKRFFLDIVWWSFTNTWPYDLNRKMSLGRIVLPNNKKLKANINFVISDERSIIEARNCFTARKQSYDYKCLKSKSTIVFYLLADGSFAVWDPARNYWKSKGKEGKDRPPAYVFSPKEVWDGLAQGRKWLCNGLIRDWAMWQKENGTEFQQLKSILEALSPSTNEILTPGALTRIDLDDIRDMPTLKMVYGQDVALVYTSPGVQKIVTLAYMLVWCWNEHILAQKLIGGNEQPELVFLIDEIESNLHQAWQRTIIPALMSVLNNLISFLKVQIISVTHSNLICSSVNSIFDATTDNMFDVVLENGHVILRNI